MSDPWVDPRIGNPWLQGLPTQGDLQANEFGMGEFIFDPDALRQREDMNSLFKEYLRVRGIHLEDYIPNLPQEVERPDPKWTPYKSEILDTYRNDEAYNKVAQLIEGDPANGVEPMGYEDALLAVEQEAMEKGWGMPMLNPDGQQMQYNNGVEQMPMTVGQFKAQQAAQQANDAKGKTTGDPTKDAWVTLLDSGAIRKNADGSFVAAPTSNFDMKEFDANAEKFMTELSLERRSQEERDAALAEYANYINPRYLVDVASMEKNGLIGGKTDYAVEWDKPKKQDGLQGRGQQPVVGESAPAAEPSYRPSLGGSEIGTGIGIGPVEQERLDARERDAGPGNQYGVKSFGIPRLQELAARGAQGPNSDLAPTAANSSQTYAEWRRADSQARQRLNNERVNAANQASRDRMNAGYQKMLQEYKRDNAVASEQQQRYAMMDEFMNSYYRGGA
jgi:hypothetical protein